MTDSLFEHDDDYSHGPRGKIIGFLDSVIYAGSLKEALNRLSVEDSRVEVFYGSEGEHAWEEMMGQSTWGEQAEKFLKQGIAVLGEGHAIFAVTVKDPKEAEKIAEIAGTHGGRSVTYFGDLVDTQFTA